MSSTYPTALDSYSTKVTGGVIAAADVNNPQAAILALEKYGLNVFNARTQFGAKGDGATDDTTALNNWLAGAAGSGSSGQGIAYLPPGNYRVTGTLQPPTTLTQGLVIMGAGRDVSVITQATQNTDTLKITKGPGRVINVSLQDLQIIGPNAGTSGYGLNMEGDVELVRTDIRNHWTGVRLFNCFYGKGVDSFIGFNVQDGLFLDTLCTTWHGRGGNRYSGNGRYGLYCPSANSAGSHVSCHGDYFESNSARGLHYDAGTGVKFMIDLHGCYFESSVSSTTHDCYIGPTTTPHQVSILGCRFNDEGSAIIHLEIVNCHSALLAGNYFGQAVSGQSLQLDAGAKGVIEIGNYYFATANRVAGSSGAILGQPNAQSSGADIAHWSSYGPAPAISAVAAGISGTPTVSGSDTSGVITLTTTGSPPAAGTKLFTVSFANLYGNTPVVLVQSQNATTPLLHCANTGSAGFDVYASANLPTSASLFAGYWVIGRN